MKCRTVVPCCVPGSHQMDGNACCSQDEAVDREKCGMVREQSEEITAGAGTRVCFGSCLGVAVAEVN